MPEIFPVWRLIDTGALGGPENMAVDEALLNCFDPGKSHPVLRFYGWLPPAFSIGRFQSPEEAVHTGMCAEAGIPIVRRLTGGGCIYHGQELTYSIVCAARHLDGSDGVKESYRRLCGFLLKAYRKLGLSSSYAIDALPDRTGLGVRTPLCYAGKEEYDILVGERKLGGNAQRRSRGVIFQHGSIPLAATFLEASPYLRTKAERWSVSLREAGAATGPAELKELLADSFRENLSVSLETSGLSAEERSAAGWLLENKYLRDSWNMEGIAP
ncbi:MAG: lipoate--protein ligase family protein [Geobacteraceae bacterium]|nr:lipoate--protein ligase family protein [Geobacteraceae bacterium]